jgi:putative NADH-flavin reductase
MRALVPAMNRHTVERVIFLSALGVGTSRAHAPLMFRTVFATAFRQIGKDKAAGEDYLHASDLDWTLVYPPALNNGPLTDSYRAGETLKLSGFAKISRADIAHFMLSQLTSSTYSRKMAIVGA